MGEIEILTFLIFWIIVGGGIGAGLGSSRGKTSEGFWLGALLGFIGWIIIAVMVANESRRRCPECMGAVPPGARKCKHCGSDLGQTTTIPMPAPQAPPGKSPYDEPVELRTRVNCPGCGYAMMATDQELHHGLKCSRCKIGFVPAAGKVS